MKESTSNPTPLHVSSYLTARNANRGVPNQNMGESSASCGILRMSFKKTSRYVDAEVSSSSGGKLHVELPFSLSILPSLSAIGLTWFDIDVNEAEVSIGLDEADG